MSRQPSRSSSRQASPREEPSIESPEQQEQDQPYSLEGTAAAWDNDSYLRARLREESHLLLHWDAKAKKVIAGGAERNVADLKVNYPVLKPLLDRMAQNNTCLPCIKNLSPEVEAIYKKCKLQVSGNRVADESWAIRKLLSLAKVQMWKAKDSIPKEPRNHGTASSLPHGFKHENW